MAFYKRAKLRNKYFEEHAPLEDPVERFVRQREKARVFLQLPPPRLVPSRPKPATIKPLKSIKNVPRVNANVLIRRLNFLLSDEAVRQQLYGRIEPGMTSYAAEKVVWQHQMEETRRCYRALYLQRLAVVTEEEREQQTIFVQGNHQARNWELLRRQRVLYEDARHRALLRDRTVLRAAAYDHRRTIARAKAIGRRLRTLHYTDSRVRPTPPNSVDYLARNVSAPSLLGQLGLSTDNDKVTKAIAPHATDIYRAVEEASFRVLPEDELELSTATTRAKAVDETVPADYVYGDLSDKSKLRILDKRMRAVTEKVQDLDNLDRYSRSNGVKQRSVRSGSEVRQRLKALLSELKSTREAHGRSSSESDAAPEDFR